MEHHAVIAAATTAPDGSGGWLVGVFLVLGLAAWAFWCWHIERSPQWRIAGRDELGRPHFVKVEKPDTRLLQFPESIAGI